MTGLLTGLLAGLMKIGVQIAFAIVGAVPFAIAWNGLAEKYAGQWIPAQFHHIPYFHVVGILLLLTFIGEIVQSITPKFVNITNNSKEAARGE